MDKIPLAIDKMADWLAYSFSQSMRNPVYAKEDLKSELIIFYLEKYKKTIPDQQWYVMMKNFMLDKYKHLIVERTFIKKLQAANPILDYDNSPDQE